MFSLVGAAAPAGREPKPVHLPAQTAPAPRVSGTPEGLLGQVLEFTANRLVMSDSSAPAQKRTVRIDGNTSFPSGARETLRAGTPVFVRLDDAKALRATAVFSLEHAVANPDPDALSQALNGALADAQRDQQLKSSMLSSRQAGIVPPTCLVNDPYPKTPDELAFNGCLGFGSYQFGANISGAPYIFMIPDVTCPTSNLLCRPPLVGLRLSRFEFGVSGGAGYFNFPVKFSAVDRDAQALDSWVRDCIANPNDSK
ncbi:MAG: hypothetical protein JST92_12595, partial [Deltaproteobacteria bacterium]|nr:hypothetical protein [Deltaproteobacteria bacterium]